MTDKQLNKKLEKIKKRGEQQKQIAAMEESYAKYYPEKKHKKVSNIMLVVIVLAIVGYVVADFMLQYHMGVEASPTITTCWFAFWSAEILALAGIKMSKTKHSSVDSYTNYEYTETVDCSDGAVE